MTNAQQMTHALGGEWRGQGGSAHCPVCQPEWRADQRALSVRQDGGKLVVFCHKGGCDFRDILDAAGLPPDTLAFDPDAALEADAKRATYYADQYARAKALGAGEADRRHKGRRLLAVAWHNLPPAAIAALGCRLLSFAQWPVACCDGGRRFDWRGSPDVLREVRGADRDQCKDDARAVRWWRCKPCGSRRPARGVRGEVETGLSLASGLPLGPATIWAALSTSGMRGLHLPDVAGRLTIASDGDEPGREVANALAERAAALGWKVSLLPAQNGRDWNDVLFLEDGKAGSGHDRGAAA